MPNFKPTPLDKKELSKLKNLTNALKTQFAFGKLKTLGDLLKTVGWTEPRLSNSYTANELSQTLTYKQLAEWLDDRRIEIETALWLQHNPPQIDTTDTQHETNLHTITNAEGHKASSSTHDRTSSSSIELAGQNRESGTSQRDYLARFKESPNEKVFFFWFQKKAIVEIMDGILGR